MAKYKLVEINHPLNAPCWRILKKTFFGWVEPSLTYAENATFYDKDEAEKNYDYLTGKTSIKETVLKANYILVFSIIIISCSKPQIESNTYIPKGVDTLPSFVVKVPVRLYLDGLNEYWTGIVKEAVGSWQSLGILDFQIVDRKELATTMVYMYADNPRYGAWGAVPSSESVPGAYIRINENSGLSRSYSLCGVVHEIGHVIGFKHLYSHLSVMNPNAMAYSGFSNFDLQLIKKYY
jgi:hypothetical protein